MKYVTCYGTIVRMTDKRWQEYLETVASGDWRSPEDFGKVVGYIEANVTDWNETEARDRLNELKELDR